jgi:NAD(P)-dependent dehydrogenase (short-subunit alcohol dehydrogenase family)
LPEARRLHGGAATVTGAVPESGAATARWLAEEGARVVLADGEEGAGVAAAGGTGAAGFLVDVMDSGAVRAPRRDQGVKTR